MWMHCWTPTSPGRASHQNTQRRHWGEPCRGHVTDDSRVCRLIPLSIISLFPLKYIQSIQGFHSGHICCKFSVYHHSLRRNTFIFIMFHWLGFHYHYFIIMYRCILLFYFSLSASHLLAYQKIWRGGGGRFDMMICTSIWTFVYDVTSQYKVGKYTRCIPNT